MGSCLLKVLCVEDSENDALLLIQELEAGGYIPVYERVWTREAMRNALRESVWDIVLSDHAMPSFTAAKALTLCREAGIDLPFIIVSGRIGEEMAVELMKAGAHDYVRKDDLSRLVPAINRELQSAQDRVIRRRAEIANAHLASIVETCDDAIISKTLDGTILSWNGGAERIYGYSADEMIGQSASILMPPGRMEELSEILKSIRGAGERVQFETARVRKDTRTIDVAMTLSPIRGASGDITAVSIVARDISQRKKEELERLALIQGLSEALARVKTLSGLLPICASCKKIRNDQGYWERVETYIQQRSNAAFTHGICPECRHSLYPELDAKLTG